MNILPAWCIPLCRPKYKLSLSLFNVLVFDECLFLFGLVLCKAYSRIVYQEYFLCEVGLYDTNDSHIGLQ